MPYISPGFMLAWNKSKVKTINLKISIGCAFEVSRKFDAYFFNITVGRRISTEMPLGPKNYTYSEIEAGILTAPFFWGAGMGIAVERKENCGCRYLLPKGSVFIGDGVFLRMDAVVEDYKPEIDIGGMLVVPFSKGLFRMRRENSRENESDLILVPEGGGELKKSGFSLLL